MMRASLRPRTFAPCALAALLAVPSPARAQERAARSNDERPALLDRAQRARTAGDHARALDDAQRAGKLHMTASLRRFIAEEQLALGRPAAAYDSADRCTREAALEPPSPNHDAILLGCRTLLQDVRSRVGLVALELREPRPPGLAVTFDGAPLDEVVREGGNPVAPGRIVVVARAPGHQPLRREVTVPAGAVVSVSIALVPIAPIATDSAPPGKRSPLGLVVLGLGVAGAAAGTATWFVAKGKYDDLRERCSAAPCPDAASERGSIETLSTASTVALVAGGALAAGGLVWYLVDVRHPAIRVAPTAAGLRLDGTF